MRSKNKRNFDLILVPKWEALRCQKGNISLYLLQNMRFRRFRHFMKKGCQKGSQNDLKMVTANALTTQIRAWRASRRDYNILDRVGECLSDLSLCERADK